MTLQEYATALRKHWLVIVALAVLGALVGYGISQFMTERFRSQTTVLVSPARGDSTVELVQGSNYVQGIVQTYAVLAQSPVVLQPVIDDLGLDETAARLATRTDVEAPLNTTVLEIGVTDATGEAAALAADAIAAEFAAAVANTSPQGADGEPAVRVSVIAPARVPTSPIAPNTRMNTAMGGAAGLGFGVLAALVLRRFGNRLTNVDHVAAVIDTPVLGEVGRAGGDGVVSMLRDQPSGRVAESVRQTTAALKFVDTEGEHRVLVVTSSGAAEGKSSTSIGLALTLADVGSRVLLIDADLRRPALATMTGLEGAVGLTSVLVGDATLDEATQVWGNERMHVLPSGPKPPNAGQLLTGSRIRALIDEARTSYEYVIIDSPPVGAVSDALWLAPAVDRMIVVARADRTREDALRRTVAAIDGTPAPVLGIVLNGVALAKSPYDSPTG